MTASSARPYRVLVTGSRDWMDVQFLNEVLGEIVDEHGKNVVLVHGNCPTGVDFLADCFGYAMGWKVERFPPDWAMHGRSAGPKRNAHMVAHGADLCLAFIKDGSRGATHCANLAAKAGLRTVRYTGTKGSSDA